MCAYIIHVLYMYVYNTCALCVYVDVLYMYMYTCIHSYNVLLYQVPDALF